MDKPVRRRWAVLTALLTATIAAALYPVEEAPVVVAQSPSKPPLKSAAAPASMPAESTQWLAVEENPFAPRTWTPAPTPVETRTVAPVIVVEAPPPLPLPFRYLGQLTDASDRVVYLGMGEELLQARLGDTLDGRYKVVALTPTQIEFETISSGLRQVLALPAQDS